MAGIICAVYKCSNYGVLNCSKSYFRFPKDRKICQQWVHVCKRKDLDTVFKKFGPDYLNKTYRVCSDHFTTTSFRNPNLPSQGLIKGQVPSQNLYQQQDTHSGVRPKKRSRNLSQGEIPEKKLRAEQITEEGNGTGTDKDPQGCLPDVRIPRLTAEQSERRIKVLQVKMKQQQKPTNSLRRPIRDMGSEMAVMNQKDYFKKSGSSIHSVDTVNRELINSSAGNENSDSLHEDLDLAQCNRRQCVTGWVCSKLPHYECRKELLSYEESYRSEDVDNSMEIYNNRDAQMLSRKISDVFNNYFVEFLNASSYKVKYRLSAMVNKPNELKVCNDCFEAFVNKYLNVMMNCFVKETNVLRGRQKGRM